MTETKRKQVELTQRIKAVEQKLIPIESKKPTLEHEIFKCRLKMLSEDECLTLVDWLQALENSAVDCKDVFDAYSRFSDFGVPDLNREFLESAIQVLAGAIDRPPRPDLSTVHFTKRPKIQADWARLSGVSY